MTKTRGLGCVCGFLLSAGVACAAQTNFLSFAYTASLVPEAATPDPSARRLNDGLWTDSAAHGVRYAGDVAVTLDLGCRVLLSEVEARTFTAEEAGAWATAGVTLEAGTDGVKPYVHVRGRLEALLTRALYADLVELAVEHDDRAGVWSGGVFWPFEAAHQL